MRIVEGLTSLAVPLGSLTPWPDNPRTHDLDLITDSLLRHGQYRPAIVQRSTQRIVIGNGMWSCAKALGAPEIAAVFLDLDDAQAAKLALLDNRTSEAGGFDEDLLASVLKDLDVFAGLDGTGYSDADLDELLERIDDRPVLPEPVDDEEEGEYADDEFPRFGAIIAADNPAEQDKLLANLTEHGFHAHAVSGYR
jgi:ParB-like chromosome segregation protein Spo0J